VLGREDGCGQVGSWWVKGGQLLGFVHIFPGQDLNQWIYQPNKQWNHKESDCRKRTSKKNSSSGPSEDTVMQVVASVSQELDGEAGVGAGLHASSKPKKEC